MLWVWMAMLSRSCWAGISVVRKARPSLFRCAVCLMTVLLVGTVAIERRGDCIIIVTESAFHTLGFDHELIPDEPALLN